VPNCLLSLERLEPQLLRREQQHGTWDRRLRDGCLVEVADRLHFRARERALEGLLAPFNPRDELRYVVLRRPVFRFDLFALVVKNEVVFVRMRMFGLWF